MESSVVRRWSADAFACTHSPTSWTWVKAASQKGARTFQPDGPPAFAPAAGLHLASIQGARTAEVIATGAWSTGSSASLGLSRETYSVCVPSVCSTIGV